MPKKKKNQPEEIRDAENLKVEESPQNGSQPQADSDLPVEDQDEVLEGEIVQEPELNLEGDSIPLKEKLALVQAALETSEAKANEYLDGWQRAQAEFTNYRKRQERERELMRFETVGRVVKRYLPIADDMQRALKDRPVEGDGVAWAEGFELIYRKLMSILDAEGITPIGGEGEMFDPNFQEAVVQTESDEHESGIVIEVLQAGYKMGERVLRPAMVRVAA
ncbi:MAG TPA: nucleotide exchange factor GrpE [Chloroflexi bacterium]|nr:nucleotide exchange factor GrpE [Chloroflexota bacterium]